MPFDKKSLHHFIYTVTIDAPLSKVWETLIDVSRWHIWDTELMSAQLDGPFQVGTTGKLIPKTGPKLPFTITELTSGESYIFETSMPRSLGYLVIRRVLRSENGVTCFTDDIQFTGNLKYLFGLVLGSGFKKVLPEVMHNFKQLAES